MLSHSRQEMLKEIAAGRSSREPSKLIRPGSEDEIQANFFSWVDLHKQKYPALQLIFAIPNAGFASKKQGILRKLTGRRAGVPDVCVPVRSVALWEGYIGLWIEFKRPGEKPTPEQLAWHEKLRNAGHRVEVRTSWTDAANLVIEYLALPLAKLK